MKMTATDKYPRTPHLPWSNADGTDRMMENVGPLINAELVMTEKLDGSNVAMTRDACFARSHSGPPQHPTFDGFKQIWNERRWYIPEGVTVFGEWCYAVHSITYDEMPYPGPYVFGIRDERHNYWWSWASTVELARQVLELPNTPVLHKWRSESRRTLQNIASGANLQSVFGGPCEGIVVRHQLGFKTYDFSRRVAKWVRPNHVQTDLHWTKRWQVQNFTRFK